MTALLLAACSGKERAAAPPVPAPTADSPAPAPSKPPTSTPSLAPRPVAPAPVAADQPPPASKVACGCPALALECVGSKVHGSNFHVDCTISNRGGVAACALQLQMDLALTRAPIVVPRHNPGQRTPSPIRIQGAAAVAAGMTGVEPKVEVWNGRCAGSSVVWTDFLEVER